jgi:hypothetical protein
MNDELYSVSRLFEKEPKASNIFLLSRYFVSNMAFPCQKEKEKKEKKCVFYFFPNKVRRICLYDLSKIYLF